MTDSEAEFEMIRGFFAAMRGEPMEAYPSEPFVQGYDLWQTRPSARGTTISTAELEQLYADCAPPAGSRLLTLSAFS